MIFMLGYEEGDKMRCKYDDETIKLIALAIGTAYRHGHSDALMLKNNNPSKLPDHYLNYLVLKLVGKDGLGLDSENKNLYERLKKIIKEVI